MFFSYKYLSLADLEQGLSCLRDEFAYDERDRQRLLNFWREMRTQDRAHATGMDDLLRPENQRLVWFGFIIFVTPEFSDYLRSDAPPIVALQALDWWESGRQPCLTWDELRRANSPGGEGVRMLVCNSGSPAALMDGPEWVLIAQKVAEYANWAVGGFHLKEFLIEAYNPFDDAWATNFGLHRITEYPRHADKRALFPPDKVPHLYGIERRRAEEQVGTGIRQLFHYDAPRFFFTSLEQEMLKSALFVETDDVLAAQLALAPVTIKKRWNAIYERVEAVMPSLLAPRPKDTESDKRGAEKKRHLLAYLRHHMEELRPTLRPMEKEGAGK